MGIFMGYVSFREGTLSSRIKSPNGQIEASELKTPLAEGPESAETCTFAHGATYLRRTIGWILRWYDAYAAMPHYNSV